MRNNITTKNSDMMTVFGTRVLITGGSRGIGLASAEAFAKEGCDVVLNHFNDTAKAEVECLALHETYGTQAHHLDADVSDNTAARTMVRKSAELLGGLDVVDSNAGICRFAPFMDIDDENWGRHVGVNFSGGFYVTQEAAKIMIRQNTGGRIIFTASIGSFRSNAMQTHYCATKGGIHLLAQGMSIELAQFGITVNCIAPGWIHTDINDAASRDTESVNKWIAAHCPTGRLGKPDDLQSAILFLASKESAYVTGSTVSVDGGWNAQL